MTRDSSVKRGDSSRIAQSAPAGSDTATRLRNLLTILRPGIGKRFPSVAAS